MNCTVVKEKQVDFSENESINRQLVKMELKEKWLG